MFISSTEGDGDTEEDDEEDEKEEVTRLVEERTYVFEPDEKRFIINEDGETVPNYYITGKGKEILSGSRYFYDALGNQTGSASFCNGELNAAHCSAWSFSKSESGMNMTFWAEWSSLRYHRKRRMAV